MLWGKNFYYFLDPVYVFVQKISLPDLTIHGKSCTLVIALLCCLDIIL